MNLSQYLFVATHRQATLMTSLKQCYYRNGSIHYEILVRLGVHGVFSHLKTLVGCISTMKHSKVLKIG